MKLKIIYSVLALVIALSVPTLGFSQPPEAIRAPNDTLVVAMPSYFSENFLPWPGGTMRMIYLTPISEYLVYRNPKTEAAKPGLATKWEMSKDGKTWTFELRKGIQFHKGWGELTSEDVKYSFEKIAAPGSRASTGSELRNLIERIETPNPYKVIFYLKKPDIEFPTALASDGSQHFIVCKKYVEEVGEKEADANPIGTGPYTLAEHRVRSSITLETIEGVENHWRVKPAFKYITFLRVSDEATRVKMLKSGEVDLAPITYDSINSVKASGLKIVSIPYNWVPVVRLGGLVLNDPARHNPNVPWADKRVRQALNYAVDKEAIVEILFMGEARPAASDQPFLEWIALKPYPYNPRKAKKLLKEAGYPNGFQMTLKTFKTSPGAELPIIGEAVAIYLKQIGIDVKVVPTDYGTVRAAWTTGKATDYCWMHRGMAFAGVVTGLKAGNTAKSPFAAYTSNDIETMLAQLEQEFDPAKRSELLSKIGQTIRDEAGYIFVAYANEPYGASKKVGTWPTPRIRPQNFELVTRP